MVFARMSFVQSSLVLLFWFWIVTPKILAADRGKPSLDQAQVAFLNYYAEMMEAEYDDSWEMGRRMQKKVEEFLEKPSAEALSAAREAWVNCREPYDQSEVGRFYDGPIENVEGFINAWPIDENYIDYTVTAPNAGIINDEVDFPQITREVILGANEKEGKKTISTGFHAIEYLLWGQDLYADSPGRRSYLDYVESAAGPGMRAVRRRQYLRLLVDLLVQHLQILTSEWAPHQPTNYRARFLALPADQALTKVFAGLGNFSSAELSGERLLVPYATKSQENEQSCFSDTTHLDLVRNETGIQDVCLGSYLSVSGVAVHGQGLIALLEDANPKLAAELRHQLETTVSALKAIPPPFDQAILGDDSKPGRVAIKKSLDALQTQSGMIAEAAEVLHIRLNLK
jgi:putative iron-regulated protein